MSVMSVPKSYAVLMGVEGYTKGMENMQRIKQALGLVKGGDDDGSGDEGKKDGRKPEEGEGLKERGGMGDGGGPSVNTDGYDAEKKHDGTN